MVFATSDQTIFLGGGSVGGVVANAMRGGGRGGVLGNVGVCKRGLMERGALEWFGG